MALIGTYPNENHEHRIPSALGAASPPMAHVGSKDDFSRLKVLEAFQSGVKYFEELKKSWVKSRLVIEEKQLLSRSQLTELRKMENEIIDIYHHALNLQEVVSLELAVPALSPLKKLDYILTNGNTQQPLVFVSRGRPDRKALEKDLHSSLHSMKLIIVLHESIKDNISSKMANSNNFIFAYTKFINKMYAARSGMSKSLSDLFTTRPVRSGGR